MISIFYILAGLVLLYIGAEGLVRGSTSLAIRFGLSPLVIGLTIVAFGTSMPEMVVSVKTALAGQSSMAFGNVIGSNSFNIGIILGLSALIYPVRIKLQLLRIDLPVMIFTALLFWMMFLNEHIYRFEGAILLLLLLLYSGANITWAQRKTRQGVKTEFDQTISHRQSSLTNELIFISLGLILLVFGANFLVNGATEVARKLGLTEAVIGLTIIAAGTSLPELATSVLAAARKQSDIAIGNVVGSNIFNILGILGISSFLKPLDGSAIQTIDLYFMLGLTILLLPLMHSDFTLKRREGMLLILLYCAYLVIILN